MNLFTLEIPPRFMTCTLPPRFLVDGLGGGDVALRELTTEEFVDTIDDQAERTSKVLLGCRGHELPAGAAARSGSANCPRAWAPCSARRQDSLSLDQARGIVERTRLQADAAELAVRDLDKLSEAIEGNGKATKSLKSEFMDFAKNADREILGVKRGFTHLFDIIALGAGAIGGVVTAIIELNREFARIAWSRLRIMDEREDVARNCVRDRILGGSEPSSSAILGGSPSTSGAPKRSPRRLTAGRRGRFRGRKAVMIGPA